MKHTHTTYLDMFSDVVGIVHVRAFEAHAAMQSTRVNWQVFEIDGTHLKVLHLKIETTSKKNIDIPWLTRHQKETRMKL